MGRMLKALKIGYADARLRLRFAQAKSRGVFPDLFPRPFAD